MSATTLHIGKAGRSRFTLPVDVATQAMAIHGVRGKGKTVTASVIVEELLKIGIQVCVLDPTDSWWGLKSTADGKGAGFPVVILGGPHGDLPLQADSGSVIADFVVDKRAPMILSLRHLRKGEQRRFVTDFAEQLYHRKGEAENRTPLFLAIDEASQYVPQRVMGDTARMVGAIQDIVRMGRSAGLGCALIDQRPATVNKDVLSQIELMVCHAVTSPQDSTALRQWIKQKDSEGREEEFMRDLASLPRGEAWFWMPIADLFEHVHVRMRKTFDSSQTPEIGKTAATPEKLAEVDLDALRGALEETIAEAEANDPKLLHKRIRELEKELRNVPAAGPDPEEIAAEIREGVDRELSTALRHLRDRVRSSVTGVSAKARALAEAVDGLVGAIDELEEIASDEELDLEAMDVAERPVRVPQARKPAPRVPTPAAAHQNGPTPTGSLPRPQQRIVDALATYESFGSMEADRTAVCAMAGYKQGGHSNNTIRDLGKSGLVHRPRDGFLALTDEGRASARAVPVGSLHEVHGRWLGLMNGPQQKLMEVLIEAWPDDITREELAQQTGYTLAGHFNNTVRDLKKLGAVGYPTKGHVAATELLFPKGLR